MRIFVENVLKAVYVMWLLVILAVSLFVGFSPMIAFNATSNGWWALGLFITAPIAFAGVQFSLALTDPLDNGHWPAWTRL